VSDDIELTVNQGEVDAVSSDQGVEVQAADGCKAIVATGEPKPDRQPEPVQSKPTGVTHSTTLTLDEPHARFEENALVVTLTFAPNRVDATQPHLMLSIRVGPIVMALQSCKAADFGALPQPIQTLLDQAHTAWPARYAESQKLKKAAEVKRPVIAAKAKPEKAARLKPKDITAPPAPQPSSPAGPQGAVVAATAATPASQPVAVAAQPQTSDAPTQTNLFDFGS
jgi:hypothetical protein